MIAKPRRITNDTNVAVSAVLNPHSAPAIAFRQVLAKEIPLLSEAMKFELTDVLSRDKFDRYVTAERRRIFVDRYFELALPVRPMETVIDCVDFKDNRILECALAGDADLILSGDDHLLRLHPWRGIAIIRPADYLMLRRVKDCVERKS